MTSETTPGGKEAQALRRTDAGALVYFDIGVSSAERIEQRLRKTGDHRRWSTIRKTLSTHQRCTVVFRDEGDKVYHLRVSGKPESLHEDIYKELGVPMLKNRQLTEVARRL